MNEDLKIGTLIGVLGEFVAHAGFVSAVNSSPQSERPSRMNNFVFSVSVLSVLITPLNAEIITGSIPGNNIATAGKQHFIDDIGIGIVIDSSGGGGFSGLGIDIFPTGSNGAVFLSSGNDGFSNHADAYFVEGQTIGGDADERAGINFWFEENNCGCKDPTIYSLGFVGEYQYIGMKVEQRDGTGGLDQHFGYIQLLRVGDEAWEPIGWAYETEANVEVVASNLVPGPSGVSLLCAGGLYLTRRRRH